MDYNVLHSEVVNDPLSRGYSGMTNQQVADSLNTVNRNKKRTTVTGQELFECALPAELNALTDPQRQQFYAICGMGSVSVQGTNTKAALLAMYGAGSATRTALLALAAGPACSRAEELDLPTPIVAAHIAYVRAY